MPGCPASPLYWNANGESPAQRSLSSWCKYTGQSEEDARAWGWLDALHPDDSAGVREEWKRIVDSPRLLLLEYRVHRSHDGYQACNALSVPLFDEAHHLQSWLVFFSEEAKNPPVIDEHWELRLMHSMIFTQVVLGVFCLSLDGAILRVNPRLCQLIGYSEQELLSMTVWQLSAPEDRKSVV